MLVPKKVKFRKWQTSRSNPKKVGNDTKGSYVSFGSFGLKSLAPARVTSNQIEAGRKAISRCLGKTGKLWIRIFPDRPFTQKPAEVKMGKGKGDVQGYCVEIRPGRIIYEVDGVPEKEAREALRKGAGKLPVKAKSVGRDGF